MKREEMKVVIVVAVAFTVVALFIGAYGIKFALTKAEERKMEEVIMEYQGLSRKEAREAAKFIRAAGIVDAEELEERFAAEKAAEKAARDDWQRRLDADRRWLRAMERRAEKRRNPTLDKDGNCPDGSKPKKVYGIEAALGKGPCG